MSTSKMFISGRKFSAYSSFISMYTAKTWVRNWFGESVIHWVIHPICNAYSLKHFPWKNPSQRMLAEAKHRISATLNILHGAIIELKISTNWQLHQPSTCSWVGKIHSTISSSSCHCRWRSFWRAGCGAVKMSWAPQAQASSKLQKLELDQLWY